MWARNEVRVRGKVAESEELKVVEMNHGVTYNYTNFTKTWLDGYNLNDILLIMVNSDVSGALSVDKKYAICVWVLYIIMFHVKL